MNNPLHQWEPFLQQSFRHKQSVRDDFEARDSKKTTVPSEQSLESHVPYSVELLDIGSVFHVKVIASTGQVSATYQTPCDGFKEQFERMY